MASAGGHVRWKNLASHGGRLGELAIAFGLRHVTRLERKSTRVCKWRENPSLEKVLEEIWRYGTLARRNLYTTTVFFEPSAIDRAPTCTRRSRTSMAGMGDKKL